MTTYQMLRIDEEIYFSNEFQILKRRRSLSKMVNSLLRERLKITFEDLPDKQKDIDLELKKISVKTSALLEKKDKLDKAKRKEEEETIIVDRVD